MSGQVAPGADIYPDRWGGLGPLVGWVFRVVARRAGQSARETTVGTDRIRTKTLQRFRHNGPEMEVDRRDLILYAYTVGAVLSGIYVERMLSDFSQPVIVTSGLLVGLPWLVYYRTAVRPRLEGTYWDSKPGAPDEES